MPVIEMTRLIARSGLRAGKGNNYVRNVEILRDVF